MRQETQCSFDLGECLGAPPGLLKPALMLLIAEKQKAYGYELGSALEELGLDVSVVGGRLYRVLRHLERDGLLRSSWDTETAGPARRLYSVTECGYRKLREADGHIRRTVGLLETIADRLEQLKDHLPKPDRCREE